MSLRIEEITKKIRVCLQQNYLPVIQKDLETQANHMSEIIKLVNRSVDCKNHSANQSIAEFREKLHLLISTSWTQEADQTLPSTYPELYQSLQLLLENIDVRQVNEQRKERFYPQQGDGFLVRIGKWNKLLLFKISRIPVYLNSNASTIRYWNHSVLLRNLISRQLSVHLIPGLKKATEYYFRNLCAEFLCIKNWEQTHSEVIKSEEILHFSQSCPEPKDVKERIWDGIQTIIDESLESFDSAVRVTYALAGTIEYPNNQLRNETIEKIRVDAEKTWAKIRSGWGNTIHALFEEWRFDLDLFTLQSKTLAELDDYQASQLKRRAEQIEPELEAINAFIKETRASLQVDSKSFVTALKKGHYQARKKLDLVLVPSLTEKLSSRHITNLIDKFEKEVHESIHVMSTDSVIVKTNSYDHPLKSDELYPIRLNELIDFEILTAFRNKLDKVRKELFSSLEQTVSVANDIDHIITFSLSSAISLYQEEGDQQEASAIAIDGLERASNRLVETNENLHSSLQHSTEILHGAVKEFCDEIKALTVNENVSELRMRIVKAKAVHQADEVKKQFGAKFTLKIKILLSALKRITDLWVQFFLKVKGRFVLTAGKPIMSKEVSDFLVESRSAIDSLPVIYQRLYQIEPLEDLELFEGRGRELEEVNLAFENWERGRFATTAILGEKWGGLTSFVSYIIKASKYPYAITRYSVKENICTEKKLVALMQTIFKNESLENLEMITEYLNEGPRRIVILEDIQNFYLRKVGGFESLRSLFQIIINTNSNIFWVTTTTIYSWQYIDKTINISEYFSYIIEMGEFSNDEIINIIWKRNRISGFNIRFLPSAEHATSKKFNVLSQEQQQALLKKRFFTQLNLFAKSNVSMALLFWLLSTRSIDNNIITVGTFSPPDLNFIKVFSLDKIYVLHALILHDGLNTQQLSQVLSSSNTACRLTLLALFEDGIVFAKNETYYVNPLVYRNIIGLLRAKNLIY